MIFADHKSQVCCGPYISQELQDTLNPTLQQYAILSIYQKKVQNLLKNNKVVSPQLHQTLVWKFIESAMKPP